MGDEVVDMKGEALLPKAVDYGLLGARQEGYELQVSFLRPVLSFTFWIILDSEGPGSVLQAGEGALRPGVFEGEERQSVRRRRLRCVLACSALLLRRNAVLRLHFSQS